MEDTEEPQTEIIEVKKEKKERTQAQKDALTRARERAFQVRREAAVERSKLREIEDHDKEQKKEMRRKQIEEEYSRISKGAEEKKNENSDEEEVEIVKRPKKKKIIRVVESSSSEDELEFRIPKKKEPIIEKSQADIDYEKRMRMIERAMEKLYTVQ